MENIHQAFDTTLPHKGLSVIADLIEYEGPLLSLLQNRSGDSFLYKWCDSNDQVNRWLLLRIADGQLQAFLRSSLSLYQIFHDPVEPFCYILDIDRSGETERCQLAALQHLPQAYLPSEDSLYIDKPVFIAQDSFNIGMTGNWNLYQISDLTKYYTVLIDLLTALTPEVQQRFGDDLVGLFRKNMWGGGSHAFLYRDLRQLSNRHQLSSMQALKVASPGKIVMQIHPTVRGNAVKVMAQLKHTKVLRHQYAQANKLIKTINHGRERQRYIVHPKDRWISDFDNQSLDAEQAEAMAHLIQEMAKALDLASEVQSFLDVTGSHFIVFQTLRACIRSLKRLDGFIANQQISQLGQTFF